MPLDFTFIIVTFGVQDSFKFYVCYTNFKAIRGVRWETKPKSVLWKREKGTLVCEQDKKENKLVNAHKILKQGGYT